MANLVVAPDQEAITIDTFIAAPPERVFQAITDPSQLVQWWGQPGAYRTTNLQIDLRRGGYWRSSGVGADGKPFHVEGEYREVDPPRVLAYTWRPSYRQIPETLVRWQLEAEDKGTRVRLNHSGFVGAADACKDHGNGWMKVLSWMQAFVERNQTIDSRTAA